MHSRILHTTLNQAHDQAPGNRHQTSQTRQRTQENAKQTLNIRHYKLDIGHQTTHNRH